MIQKRESGQITIFFAIVVVVMITMIAFIINIGIFVKAKINLQNATDAAAYAGASVQARQLSNIAYMNWEMRNTYKEWMFKYYVLGGLNLKGVSQVTPRTPCDTRVGGEGMDFTMCPYQTGSKPVVDSFNFPSVCIDFAGTGSVGLCTKMLVPGLPRFKSSEVLGLDETTNAFVDIIVSKKGKDCTRRSELNFLTANTWAYNVPDGVDANARNISNQAPQIAINRVGAFPKAFEVALRIRNLEHQMNRAPHSKICKNQSDSPDCENSIDNIVGGEPSPSNERIYKAFYSGYRNLGSQEDNLLRRTFTLTEVPPSPFQDSNAFSLSNLLIPSDKQQKHYLDLKLMPINFATFYTAFTTGTGTYAVTGSTDATPSEGECTATKMGLPVPGYPLGFVKNPNFLTYYAVKGEASFVGLFNPFDVDTITLTAYSAAKPFGGRIGPVLFDTSDTLQIKPRGQSDPNSKKSSPYMLTLDTTQLLDSFGENIGKGEYKPGVPLPLNQGASDFWTPEGGSLVVGGFAGGSSAITFGIPNMIYDYPGDSITSKSEYSAEGSNLIQSVSAIRALKGIKAGLYNKNMFDKLRSKLDGIGGAVTTQNIDNGISMARAVTRYETHNYLVPTPENINSAAQTDSFGAITERDADGASSRELRDTRGTSYRKYNYQIYAPLYSPVPVSALFRTANEVNGVLENYLRSQKSAIDKYIESMSVAAQNIYKNTISSNTSQELGLEAANGISDISVDTLRNGIPADVIGKKPTCASIAGQFAYYYLGAEDSGVSGDGCPEPFKEILIKRWSNTSFADSYEIEYVISNDMAEEFFTAYRPTTEHDAANGIQVNANGGVLKSSDKMIRNTYSTKFIALSSLVSGTRESYGGSMSTISEGNTNIKSGSPTSQNGLGNPLSIDSVNLDLTKVKY